MLTRCLGCMKLYDSENGICPRCGYTAETPAEKPFYLSPGTILQNRYLVGKALRSDAATISYIGWDQKEEHRVEVTEFYRSDLCARGEGSPAVETRVGIEAAVFEDAKNSFLEKYQQKHRDSEVVFEENNTAYVIAVSSEKAWFIWPLWLKILLPLMGALLLTLAALMLAGVIRFTAPGGDPVTTPVVADTNETATDRSTEEIPGSSEEEEMESSVTDTLPVASENAESETETEEALPESSDESVPEETQTNQSTVVTSKATESSSAEATKPSSTTPSATTAAPPAPTTVVSTTAEATTAAPTTAEATTAAPTTAEATTAAPTTAEATTAAPTTAEATTAAPTTAEPTTPEATTQAETTAEVTTEEETQAPAKYTLFFDANGGNVSESSRLLEVGAAFGSLPTPTRDDYIFDGWFTQKDGGSQVSASSVMGNSDLTVYAHWHKKPVSVGDIITFGCYGNRAIEWQVLAVSGNKVLVVSRYAQTASYYHGYNVAITWEDSMIRTFLNGTFYKQAFSDAEKSRIQTTLVKNEDNPSNGYDGGNDTNDKVFLLSYSEINMYLPSQASRICIPTQYAKDHGCATNNTGACVWRLRTPGPSKTWEMGINYDGQFCDIAQTNEKYGIRPALWYVPEE